MAADVSQLVLDYVQKSGVKMNIPLSAAMSIVASKIALAEEIDKDLTERFAKWGKGAFVECPNCKSNTILEFYTCHWCDAPLMESTRPTNEVTVTTPEETQRRPVQVQMGKEPPATLNFGGAPSKSEVKKEEPVVESKPQAEIPVEEKIALYKGMIETAESLETNGNELAEINKMANLNIDPKKDCNGKKSLFRKAIIDGLNAAIEALKIEEPVAEVKPKAKRTRGKKAVADDGDEVLDDPTPFKNEKEAKGKKKAKVVEIDESELEAEEEKKPLKKAKGKAGKSKVVDEEPTPEELDEDADLFADDEGDEDVDGEEEVVAVTEDDDFSDIDLDTIAVDDLKEEDFDLDDE